MIAPIVLILLGLVLAFAGRRFIWLLVGLAGFVLGYNLITFFIPGQGGTIQILIGIIVGLVVGFLATIFTRLLLYLAGFILIGNLALTAGAIIGLDNLLVQVLIFIVGGLVGLGLVLFAFDTSLVLISALGGAAMVMQGFGQIFETFPDLLSGLVWLVVAVAGMVVQWRFVSTDKAASK